MNLVLEKTWWIATVAYLCGIYYLSSIPNGLNLPVFPFDDKLYHAVEFGLLAVVVLKLFQNIRPSRWNPLWAWLFIALFAFTDEWHQMFVANRFSDWSDWVADVVGGMLFLYLARRWEGSSLAARVRNLPSSLVHPTQSS